MAPQRSGRRSGVLPAWPVRRGGAGFTLLEIMIVLVLMLGVIAIALPLTLQDTGRAAFREAQEQLEAMMLSARADAQRGGRTVRVVAARTEDAGRWELREEEVANLATLAVGAEGRGVRPRVVQTASLPAGVRLARSEDEAWGVSVLGDGLGFDEEEEADQDMVSIVEDGGATGVEVQVAVFLPDGQISASEPLYLCGGDDGNGGAMRVARVAVNSWTGVLMVTELQRTVGGEPADVDAGPDIEGEDAAGP